MTTFTVQRSETFLFADDCPAPAPCSCSGIPDSAFLMCSKKHLTSVPLFHSSNLHTNEIYVFLDKNNLTRIQNYAFRSLSTMHASSIHMQLDSNAIFYIEQHAFDGIENAVTELHLQNNELTSVPTAVGRLQKLKNLDITNNPLQYLGVSSMSGLGQSLKSLYIDLSTFTVWPTELVSLRNLEKLTISTLPYETLNSSYFGGFENSLKSLTINDAPKLKSVPCVLAQLPKLMSFYLEHAGQLETNDTNFMVSNCSQQSHSVSMFSLENSNLTTFPDVLHNFPTTTSLKLLGNSLEIIEIEKIRSGNMLTEVDLALNNFRRIPSASNRMVNLTDLDLSKNFILSVEDIDLSGLYKLQKLSLSDNPVRYISTHAFDNNKQLVELNLANTNLRTIPVSVTSLVHLNNIDFRGANIACGCEMTYLKHWNIRSITSFYGVCANTNAPLKVYITSYLPVCH